MEFSPEGGKQVVKETVFQLISHNQHLETLTREVCVYFTSPMIKIITTLTTLHHDWE